MRVRRAARHSFCDCLCAQHIDAFKVDVACASHRAGTVDQGVGAIQQPIQAGWIVQAREQPFDTFDGYLPASTAGNRTTRERPGAVALLAETFK